MSLLLSSTTVTAAIRLILPLSPLLSVLVSIVRVGPSEVLSRAPVLDRYLFLRDVLLQHVNEVGTHDLDLVGSERIDPWSDKGPDRSEGVGGIDEEHFPQSLRVAGLVNLQCATEHPQSHEVRHHGYGLHVKHDDLLLDQLPVLGGGLLQTRHHVLLLTDVSHEYLVLTEQSLYHREVCRYLQHMQQESQNDGWSQANTSPSCLLTLSGLLPKYGTAFAILPQVSMRQMRNVNVLLLIRCIQYMLGRDGQSWQRRGPPRVPIVHHGYRLWQVIKPRP